jgi:hypothetical protein
MADIWTDRLSEYIDDELTLAERTAVEAHLTSCRDCSTTIAQLRAVAERARHLPGRPPHADLWPGIESRLTPSRSARRANAGWRFTFTLPQLVAAGLALMVMSGGGMWILLHGGRATSMPPVAAVDPLNDPARLVNARLAEQRYDEAIADLQQALASGRSQLDPATIAILEANLKTIDAAIEQSRQALANDADNVYLNNHLADARQRKLALLRRAAALVGGKT